jgi:hypothetical protein
MGSSLGEVKVNLETMETEVIELSDLDDTGFFSEKTIEKVMESIRNGVFQIRSVQMS